MKLPAVITRMLPARDLKPKGEICTLPQPPTFVPKEVLVVQKLDPKDLTKVKIKLDTATQLYHHYWFIDTETGYKEKVLIDNNKLSYPPSDFDKAIIGEKQRFRIASTNQARHGML